MLRKSIVALGLLFAAQSALAAEAGKVIFVAGQAQADKADVALGAPVEEGQLLATGSNGYIYVKTIDDGLFILRPNTRARIVTYRVDTANPKNTRIKLELLSGTARSRSGQAVKLARQNFRFNTPVAAIGVRGTDFTVFTDDLTSRVAVLDGGITVSGFAGGCSPEGNGPCEGDASRELFASQKGHLLQIKRGEAAAQLVKAGALSPNAVEPPRPNEPEISASPAPAPGPAGPAPTLDPIKSGVLEQQAGSTPKPPPTPDGGGSTPPVPPETNPEPEPPVIEPPVVQPPVEQPKPTPVEPTKTVVWGRFQPIADQPAQLVLGDQTAQGAKVLNLKGNYALLRTAGKEVVIPERGEVGFALQQSEAYIYSDNPAVKPVQASLENGQLRFDFDKRKFATSFDLVNAAERTNMHATGSVSRDGRFSVDSQWAPGNNMIVDGALGGADAGTAAYLFQGRLSGDRSVIGGTTWGRIPTP